VEGTEAENGKETYNWAKKKEACPQHDELVPPVIDSSGCVRFLMSRGEETILPAWSTYCHIIHYLLDR